MVPVAHWDDPAVAFRDRDNGHIGGRWYGLGEAAGSVTVGLTRMIVPEGRWTTPAHRHGNEEEIFFILDGTGTSWQDGNCYDVRAGDCLVHLAGAETHTLRAGAGGLDLLAFGTRRPDDTAHLPRAGSRSFHRSLAKMSSWTLTARSVAICQNGGKIQSARKTTASRSSRAGRARCNVRISR